MKKIFLLSAFLLCGLLASSQNSLVGDGFGGRLWYKPYNYTVGSYSGYTVCGLEQQLYGWGSNFLGELGVSGIFTSAKPLAVPLMDNVIYYSTGYTMGAIKKDSSGWVWGNFGGPTKVIDDVFFVDAGIAVCAFVKTDGTVWSIGTDYYGVFGNGLLSNTSFSVPVQMKSISNAVRTAQGNSTTLVLLADGTVKAAGFGPGLGNGVGGGGAYVPTDVKILKDIIDIKAGTFWNIALDKNGDVWSWGESSFYGSAQGLGSSSADSSSTPGKIPYLKDIVAISGCNDGFHFLALDKDKNCYAWGNNQNGQCGNGNTNHVLKPQLVATNVVDIMAGEWFSYIVKSDGSLWCAGYAGEIWLDKSVAQRENFTKLNPAVEDIGLCNPSEHGDTSIYQPQPIDSTMYPSEAAIFFPNAFSPNGDGNNDIFRAIKRPNANIATFKMEIYNRWGQRVFYTENVDAGWDGSFFDEAQPISTYPFTVWFSTPNRKPLFIKGDVTLVR